MTRATSLYALLAVLLSTSAWGLTFDRYHSQEEVNRFLLDLAKDHPDLVQTHKVGQSSRGRPILLAEVGSGKQTGKPGIYFNASHHGDEKITVEAVIGLAQYLVANKKQAKLREILKHYTIYIQPFVNPDGFAWQTRNDSLDRDPNRDYPQPGKSDDEAFTMPETRLVKKLLATKNIKAAAALHSGNSGVFWPWCHTPIPPKNVDTLFTIASHTAEALGVHRALQSYMDYPAAGEFIDYAYDRHSTLAFTLEISPRKSPQTKAMGTIIKSTISGSLAFISQIFDLHQGRLAIAQAPKVNVPAPFARLDRQLTLSNSLGLGSTTAR